MTSLTVRQTVMTREVSALQVRICHSNERARLLLPNLSIKACSYEKFADRLNNGNEWLHLIDVYSRPCWLTTWLHKLVKILYSMFMINTSASKIIEILKQSY